MGIDAYIFAERARRCFYFDRQKNLLQGAGGMPEDLEEIFWRIKSRASGGTPPWISIPPKAGAGDTCTKEEVLRLVRWNREDRDDREEDEERRHRRLHWNELIERFVREYPEDRFFVWSDHDDPPSWDIIEKERYQPIEYAWEGEGHETS